MTRPWAGILILICGCTIWAQTRLTTLHHIPTGDFLWNNQYMFRVNTNFFKALNYDKETQSVNDSASGFKLTAIGELLFGINERFTIGAQFGWKPSLSFKGKVLSEKGDYFPTVTLEANSIMGSPEARFYKVHDPDTLRWLQNGAALIASKSFKPINLRLHLGVQSFPAWDSERFSPFGGIEHYLGAGLYVGMEVFQRFDTLHTNVGITWRDEKWLIVSAGLSEFKEYFFNDQGEFGVYIGKREPRPTGYGSPGLWLTVAFSGNLASRGDDESLDLEDEMRIQNTRMARLENELKNLRDTVKIQQAALSGADRRLKQLGIGLDGKMNMNVAGANVRNQLKEISRILGSETPYDPKDINRRVDKILAMGNEALPALKTYALDRSADPRMRGYAVHIMGRMKKTADSDIRDILVNLLSEPSVDLRIEALLAIGKRKEKDALPEVRLLTSDPDEAIAITAQSVVEQLEPQRTNLEKTGTTGQ